MAKKIHLAAIPLSRAGTARAVAVRMAATHQAGIGSCRHSPCPPRNIGFELLSSFLSTLVVAAAAVLIPVEAFCQRVDDRIAVDAADWPWWRGPQRNGVANPKQDPPTEWSATENVAWKSAIPGRGHSSPTVVGRRVFLATADEQQGTQSVLCYDRETGKQLWQAEVHRGGLMRKNEKSIRGLRHGGLRRRKRVRQFRQWRGRVRHGHQRRRQAAMANEDRRLHDSSGLRCLAGLVSVAGDCGGR